MRKMRILITCLEQIRDVRHETRAVKLVIGWLALKLFLDDAISFKPHSVRYQQRSARDHQRVEARRCSGRGEFESAEKAVELVRTCSAVVLEGA
jgi:hypothetical protein